MDNTDVNYENFIGAIYDQNIDSSRSICALFSQEEVVKLDSQLLTLLYETVEIKGYYCYYRELIFAYSILVGNETLYKLYSDIINKDYAIQIYIELMKCRKFCISTESLICK